MIDTCLTPKTPASRARAGEFMKKGSIEVAKAQGIGAMHFVMNSGFRHCVFEVSFINVSVTVYCDSLGELEHAKSLLRPFMTDGCCLKDSYLSESDCYYVQVEWPFPYYNAV